MARPKLLTKYLGQIVTTPLFASGHRVFKGNKNIYMVTSFYSTLGSSQQAPQPTYEGSDIYRLLAQQNLRPFLPTMAMSLHNLASVGRPSNTPARLPIFTVASLKLAPTSSSPTWP
jgi:hypothetical protein